jgi:hypothetical protein
MIHGTTMYHRMTDQDIDRGSIRGLEVSLVGRPRETRQTRPKPPEFIDGNAAARSANAPYQRRDAHDTWHYHVSADDGP